MARSSATVRPFREALVEAATGAELRLSAPERKLIESTLSERDPEAEVSAAGKGRPETGLGTA